MLPTMVSASFQQNGPNAVFATSPRSGNRISLLLRQLPAPL
jgi:hypothetical protein